MSCEHLGNRKRNASRGGKGLEHCVDETPDDGAAFGGEEDEEHVHGGDEAREVTCGHYAQQRLVDFGERSSVVGEKGRFSDAEVRIESIR